MREKETARPGEPERFEKDEKIVFQRYSSTQIIAALDTSKYYTLGTTIIAHSISEYSNTFPSIPVRYSKINDQKA